MSVILIFFTLPATEARESQTRKLTGTEGAWTFTTDTGQKFTTAFEQLAVFRDCASLITLERKKTTLEA